MKKLFFLLFITAYLSSCGGEGSDLPKKIDSKAIDSPKNESNDKESVALSQEDIKGASYTIPSPGEALSALNKLGNVQWNNYVKYSSNTDYSNKYVQSLNLGVRVADAFIAVNSEDKENLQNMANTIFTLSEKLDVGKEMQGQKGSIDKLIQQGNWKVLKSMTDNVYDMVRIDAEEGDKSDLATLANVGGWLEGVRVIGKHLENSYNEENSEILSQGNLIDYHIEELNKLGTEAKGHTLIGKVNQGLAKIRDILGSQSEATVSLDKIKQLNGITTDLINAIVTL